VAAGGWWASQFLEGLVQPLHLAADLWVVGLGAAVRDAQGDELTLERDPAAAAEVTGEDRAVVGEQAFRAAVAGHRGVQVGDDVAGLEHRAGGGTGQQPGMVIDDVEDLYLALDAAMVDQLPVGDVGLPALVR
jgi:hypothetical protein